MLAIVNTKEIPERETIIKDNVIVSSKPLTESNLNIGQVLIQSFNANPDFIGMLDAETGETVTFGEMKNRSVRCALWLRKQGLTEDDVVVISTPLSIDDYVPYLAALYNNAVIIAMAHDVTEEHAQYCFDTFRPKFAFACNESITKIAKVAALSTNPCKLVTFEKHSNYPSLFEINSEQTTQQVNEFEAICPIDPKKKLTLIFFTSGTTGKPKAVLVPYQSQLTHDMEEDSFRPGMICLWYSPIGWPDCNILIINAIRTRCTRVIHKNFEPEQLANIVNKYKINYIYSRPYLIISCYHAGIFKRHDLSHLEVINFAGTKLNKSVMADIANDLPNTHIGSIYGTTEAGGFLTRQTRNRKHLESIGFPYSGSQIKVLDTETGRTVGPNIEGEIYYKSEKLMLGYYKNPEATRESLDDDGWMRSGDLGFYTEDGEIILRDRLKSIIKPRFNRCISSAEFEEALLEHPDVRNAAVVAVEHPIDVERPFIFVVTSPGAKVTSEELIEFAAKKNEAYAVISGLVFLDDMPLARGGKKAIKELNKLARDAVNVTL